jgi:uncharacterized Fe-S center protein
MPSKVYFCRIEDWGDPKYVAGRFAEMLAKMPLLDEVRERDLVGIKLTFGEAGNTGHAPPPLIRQLVKAIRKRGGRPFVTETNTLYNGRRKNAVEHLKVAREHGFTHASLDAPIILGDGILGRENYDVAVAGKHVQMAHLAPSVRDMDFLVAVAHMTGHMVEGFGGALKNVGMGLASRAGKLDQHSAVSPFIDDELCILCHACFDVCPVDAISEEHGSALVDRTTCIGCADCIAVCPTNAMKIDWSREALQVQEATVEYALAVVRALSGRAAFVNLLNHISRDCDCMGPTKDILAPDLGIVASADPVAVDQASVDLVNRAAGEDAFRRAWPRIDPLAQTRHAEALGLGSSDYALEEL